MSPAMESSLGVVAYLALFAGVGILFLFVNLLVGKLVRPSDPHEEKIEIYECGEPTIGSSFVQFDLRFYVVALLFIIFDVEVAFFFPWAAVFGKLTNETDPRFVIVGRTEQGEVALTPQARALYQELGVRNPAVITTVPETLTERVSSVREVERVQEIAREGALQLALVTLVDIAVFFAILLIGFAYVWKRGDLDWVRAVSDEHRRPEAFPVLRRTPDQPALSA